MSSLWNCLAFTILLLYSVNGALGLKCYFCVDHAGGNPACRKNPNSSIVMECNPKVFNEHKNQLGFKGLFNNTQIFDSDSAGEWNCMILINKYQNTEIFTRACAPVNAVCKQKEERSQGGEFQMVKKCCNTDLCNSSFKTNAGLFTLSICLIFVTLFWK